LAGIFPCAVPLAYSRPPGCQGETLQPAHYRCRQPTGRISPNNWTAIPTPGPVVTPALSNLKVGPRRTEQLFASSLATPLVSRQKINKTA